MSNVVIFIGHFAENDPNPSGQHIRSSLIRQLVSDVDKESDFVSIDLSGNKVKCLFALLRETGKSNKIVPILAQKSTFPICMLLWLTGRSKITEYFAVGGWLPMFLKEHHFLQYILKRMKLVVVQTEPMRNVLLNEGFDNVLVLPNFRNHSNCNREIRKTTVKKFVFCARITREKGAGLAIQAMEDAIKQTGGNLSIDFYGSIKEDFHDEFYQLLDGKTFCNYKGYIDNKDVVETLSKYDCMILPTYYVGEGFPGSILEAFMAGIPVITTDWNYNKEYVFNGINGILCKPNDLNDLTSSIIEMINYSPNKIEEISSNAYEEGEKYSYDHAKKLYINAISDNV